jgi:hypothetical protein
MSEPRYQIVTESIGPQRDFRITIGLREGYQASGRIYDIEEAVRAAHAWMKRRAEAGQPFLSGMFTRGEVVYAWPGADGKAGSDRELVAIFSGEAVPLYTGHLDDATVRALLNELATEMAEALGQEDVHLSFRDQAWALRRQKSEV